MGDSVHWPTEVHKCESSSNLQNQGRAGCSGPAGWILQIKGLAPAPKGAILGLRMLPSQLWWQDSRQTSSCLLGEPDRRNGDQSCLKRPLYFAVSFLL